MAGLVPACPGHPRLSCPVRALAVARATAAARPRSRCARREALHRCKVEGCASPPRHRTSIRPMRPSRFARSTPMNTRHPALAALALATALAGGAGFSALTAPNAAAQATTAPQQTQQEPERHHSASRHIDGRTAFLKAELKITDAQAPQFDR